MSIMSGNVRKLSEGLLDLRAPFLTYGSIANFCFTGTETHMIVTAAFEDVNCRIPEEPGWYFTTSL